MWTYSDRVDNLKEDLSPLRKELRRISEQLRQSREGAHSLRIVVAGGFSCGKSAFINKLLGAKVAEEGTTATTRCSTEYFHSDVHCWHEDGGKEISEDEYLQQSCEKGSKKRFRVGVPCDFLDGGILLIDTPGFGDNEDDSDNAKAEVRKCDILFWLVNANGGTIKASELEALLEATNGGGERKPLAVLLTQIDKVDGKDNLEFVRKHITGLLQEKSLRLVHPPLPVSKEDDPQEVPPSLRPFIVAQRQEIAKIVADCKRAGVGKSHVLEERLVRRCRELAERIDAICDAARDQMLECRQEVEDRIERASKECERRFRHDVAEIVEGHVSGMNVYSSNEAIGSYKSKECLVWHDYTAYFRPTVEFLEPHVLNAKIGWSLAKYSDYHGGPLECGGAHQAILDAISSKVHRATCDSLGDNESKAREIVACRARCALREFSFDEVKDKFFRALTLPKIEWKSPNIDSMHQELAEIAQCLTRIKSQRPGKDVKVSAERGNASRVPMNSGMLRMYSLFKSYVATSNAKRTK